jgi:hypothetical protein
MMRVERSSFARLRLALALVAVVAIAGAVLSGAPLFECPGCSGAGKITVMGSHPEAMASAMSPTGKLIEVGCPRCKGTTRDSLLRRWTGE